MEKEERKEVYGKHKLFLKNLEEINNFKIVMGVVNYIYSPIKFKINNWANQYGPHSITQIKPTKWI